MKTKMNFTAKEENAILKNMDKIKHYLNENYSKINQEITIALKYNKKKNEELFLILKPTNDELEIWGRTGRFLLSWDSEASKKYSFKHGHIKNNLDYCYELINNWESVKKALINAQEEQKKKEEERAFLYDFEV